MNILVHPETTLDDMVGHRLQMPDLRSVTEWAEETRHLSSKYSSMPGRFTTVNTPYMREPMECLQDFSIRMVTLLWGSQCGKTTVLENVLGYSAVCSPRPAMWVMPDDATSTDILEERLKPTIEQSEAWAAELAEGAKAIQQGKISFRRMTCFMPISSSSSQLAGKSIGLVIADEIDKYPPSTKGEGSPLDQLRARTRTFMGGKMYQSSTPTDEAGNIWKQYQTSDRREWWIKCPAGCGHEGPWAWANIKWEERPRDRPRQEWCALVESDPSMAWWECPRCKHRVSGVAGKLAMNRAARWHRTGPAGWHAGFHLPSLASPFTTFHMLAAEWMRAMDAKDAGDLEKFKHFKRHEEALPAREVAKSAEVDIITSRSDASMPRRVVPSWVDVVVLGADVQQEEVYWTLWGFSKVGRRAHLVDHGIAPDLESVVPELDGLAREGTGAVVRVAGGFIDSGFRTQEVYDFCYRHRARKLFPSKGYQYLKGARARWQKSTAFVSLGVEIPLYNLDTNALKVMFFNLINRGRDAQFPTSYHAEIDDTLARQLVAEHQVEKKSKATGKKTHVFAIRPGFGGNHYLDGSVYALAFADAAVLAKETTGRGGGEVPAGGRPGGAQGQAPRRDTWRNNGRAGW